MLLAASLVASTGCVRSHRTAPKAKKPTPVLDAGDGTDAGDDDAGPVAMEPPPPDPQQVECDRQIKKALDGLPDDLICTGMYKDLEAKIISPDIHAYAPSEPLWSDGAGKMRFVYLPPGTVIDATDPNEWVFPVGTKFFKEFRVDGRRVETRVFMKQRKDRWVRATYEWDRDETTAKRSQGSDRTDVHIAGKQYHVPNGRECDQCHGGRKDRILGFEAISLGLPDAKGMTLSKLVEAKLISPAPARTKLMMGDDGTGEAGEVMGWLHINCGVTCHNDNENSEAYQSDLWMKMRVGELDGRPVTDFDAYTKTVGVATKSTTWGTGRKRIVPGSPEQSVLYQLITSRAGSKQQMPPIASQVVDTEHTTAVADWIRALK